MSKNNKICKIITKVAVAGASIAAAVAIFSKYKKNNTKPQETPIPEEDDDFDNCDFAEIGKDAPREYVSININERVNRE